MRELFGALLALAALAFAPLAMAAAPPAEEPAVQQEARPDGVSVTALQAMLAEFDANYADAREALRGPLQNYSTERMAQLNELRSRLAADRDRAAALAARGSIATRVFEAQITALGAPPAEGESEPAAVTARRELLQERLGRTMTPVLEVRDASVRASVIVNELDERIRRQENRQKFERGYSPLNPALWLHTGGDIAAGWGKAGAHLSGMNAQYSALALVLLAIGAVVMLAITPLIAIGLRKRLWRRLDRRIDATESLARRMLFVLSRDMLAGFVLLVAVVIGAFAICLLLALFVPPTNMLTLFVASILGGVIVAIGEWLGRSALRSPFPELRLLKLPDDHAREGVVIVRRMTILLALEVIIAALEEDALISTEISRLLSAVVTATGAWLVWKLADLLHEASRLVSEERRASFTNPDEAPHRIDFANPISRLLKVIAIAAIVATVIGYVLLARDLFSSLLLSLGLVGTALYLHRTVGMVTRAAAEGPLKRWRKPLHFVPLVVGAVLTLLVLPLLAIIWGYSANEIGDGIVALRDGVEFGDVRLSFGDVMTFIIVFLVGYFVTRWLQRFLNLAVLPEFGVEKGVQAALITGIGYVGFMLAAVVAIASTGLDLSSLAFVAGALSVGLGFGLQAVIENFTSGILLLVERPVREGDWIQVGEHEGIVKKIAVRSTHIETFDRHQIIIPNSKLITEAVINRSLTGEPARIIIPIGVAYGSDLEKAKSALLDVASANPRVLVEPAPAVAMDGFGDSAIDLKLLAFVDHVADGPGIRSDLMMAIAREFGERGIEIPFPQRDLNIREVPPALMGQQTGATA